MSKTSAKNRKFHAIEIGLCLLSLVPSIASFLVALSLTKDLLILSLIGLIAVASFGGCLFLIRRSQQRLKVSRERNVDLREKLEKSNTESHRFIVDTIVELRRPLNDIMGILQVNDDIRQDVKDSLSMSSQRMLEQLEHVQYFSELESGHADFEKKEFVLSELIDQVFVVAEEHYSLSRSIEVSVDISPNLPQKMLAPKEAIELILSNLVDNAFKFTEKGRIKLDVKPSENADKFVFLLKDTGAGMTEARRLEVYQSLDEINSNLQWSHCPAGIGLSVAGAIIKNLGGKIQIETELGFGTTVRLELPLSHKEKPLRKMQDISQIEKFGLEKKKHRKEVPILVVDDEAFAREVVCRMLTKFGYEFMCAENGLEAYELCEDYDFQLILMDIQMPILDGIESTRQILAREEGSAPAIVAVTSHTRLADKKLCSEVGMANFLPKPVRIDQLQKILSSYVKSSPMKTISSSAPKQRVMEESAEDTFAMIKSAADETSAEATMAKVIDIRDEIQRRKESQAEDPTHLFDLESMYKYSGHNIDLCREFLKMSRDSNHKLINELEEGIRLNDEKKVIFACHKLKGNLTFLACERGVSFTVEIETLLKKGFNENSKEKMRYLLGLLVEVVEQADKLEISEELLRQAS